MESGLCCVLRYDDQIVPDCSGDSSWTQSSTNNNSHLVNNNLLIGSSGSIGSADSGLGHPGVHHSGVNSYSANSATNSNCAILDSWLQQMQVKFTL